MTPAKIDASGWDVSALERSEDAACTLDRGLRLSWTNPAWERFGDANGGDRTSWTGRKYTDAILPPLDTWYADRLERALRGTEPWSHEYLCPAPNLERRFQLLAYPVADERLLLIHSLIVERLHDTTGAPSADEREKHYRDSTGAAHQCMHCRRTRRLDATERWDWIPEWVAQSPPRTSHGLCAACLAFYYPSP